VRYNKDRHQYQLVKGGSGEEPEEVMLRLTGILTRCELPPVLKLPRYFNTMTNIKLTHKFQESNAPQTGNTIDRSGYSQI
jgi:hypothetical protein